MTDSAFNELFTRLDTDLSGAINYTEFLTGAIDWTLANNDENLLLAFKFFDKNNSGTIDREEIRKAIRTGWISEVQLTKLFDEIDLNKDQQVSKAHIIAIDILP